MNERIINDLAEQSWVYQIRVYEDNGVRTYGEREQVFSKEKFAELIIKECTTALEEMPLYSRIGKDREFEVATISDAILAINTRFGVES